MTKRLFIDLEKCDACAECVVKCAYFFQPKATEHGMLALRELAAFAVVCRRCEDPSCVAACKFEALERREDQILKRWNLRCVSCKCCSQACPFGVILPDLLPFYVSACDFCALSPDTEPPCVVSCIKGAVEFREMEASEKDGTYQVGEHLVVRARKWEKKDV